MKTKEELNALKKEYEELTVKLRELTDEELKQVAGGWGNPYTDCIVYNTLLNLLNNGDMTLFKKLLYEMIHTKCLEGRYTCDDCPAHNIKWLKYLLP